MDPWADFSKLWEQDGGMENQFSGGDNWTAQLKKTFLVDVQEGGNPNAARAAESGMPSDSFPNKSKENCLS